MNSALFLDRDGVIIHNRAHYVRTWKDVVFYPQALKALESIRHAPLKIILVTNQSAVGRGIIALDAALEINTRVVQTVQQAGGRVDDTFMCPHAPEEHCSCRKPQPGLFLQAAEKYSLDLSRCICIGDALSDVRAAENAGIGLRMMLLTGRGKKQLSLPEASSLKPFLHFNTLASAIAHLPPQLLG